MSDISQTRALFESDAAYRTRLTQERSVMDLVETRARRTAVLFFALNTLIVIALLGLVLTLGAAPLALAAVVVAQAALTVHLVRTLMRIRTGTLSLAEILRHGGESIPD